MAVDEEEEEVVEAEEKDATEVEAAEDVDDTRLDMDVIETTGLLSVGALACIVVEVTLLEPERRSSAMRLSFL